MKPTKLVNLTKKLYKAIGKATPKFYFVGTSEQCVAEIYNVLSATGQIVCPGVQRVDGPLPTAFDRSVVRLLTQVAPPDAFQGAWLFEEAAFISVDSAQTRQMPSGWVGNSFDEVVAAEVVRVTCSMHVDELHELEHQVATWEARVSVAEQDVIWRVEGAEKAAVKAAVKESLARLGDDGSIRRAERARKEAKTEARRLEKYRATAVRAKERLATYEAELEAVKAKMRLMDAEAMQVQIDKAAAVRAAKDAMWAGIDRMLGR